MHIRSPMQGKLAGIQGNQLIINEPAWSESSVGRAQSGPRHIGAHHGQAGGVIFKTMKPETLK